MNFMQRGFPSMMTGFSVTMLMTGFFVLKLDKVIQKTDVNESAVVHKTQNDSITSAFTY